MFSTITTGALLGVEAYLVNVEVDIAGGLPSFSMVGLLGGEVRESRERVCVALKNTGLDIPPTRITVNLSPADRKKEGTAFDLPIAIGILESLGYFPRASTENTLFLGELGLNGEIKKVRGILPIVREAAARGIKQCIIPKDNVTEGAVIPGIEVHGAGSLEELLAYLQCPEEGQAILPPIQIKAEKLFGDKHQKVKNDFAEVGGQETAKRAAKIAAAGFHNLLMIGPPGAGKSMIAKRIPGILPSLTLKESLEVTSVVSVAGLLKEKEALITTRPFQAPHHTISLTALTGGSHIPRPGLISLAHRGVLFLDELPEFQRATLDSLRQPLEERQIQIARVNGNITYPADFVLVAAMNPCPCGYYPDMNRCRCTEAQVKRYMSRVSGPILDRIDLCVELQPVDILKRNGSPTENSADIRENVAAARRMQEKRFRGTEYRFNGDIEAADIEKFCALGPEEQKVMEQIYHSLQLSARAYHRILKVARTIADLEESDRIKGEHLLEAACYRPAQDYWR